jgi:hypothetical protein
MLKQELAIPEGGIAERLGELRMMYDDKWLEGRPDIKVAGSYDDFTAETTKHDAGVNDGDDASTKDGEEKSGDEGADAGGDEAVDKVEGGNDKEDKGDEGSEDKKDKEQSDVPPEEPEEPRSLGALDKDING